MSLRVMKFGGTSVGSPENIRNVAGRVGAALKKGDKVVVVVSAMSGETDRLTGLAHDVSSNPDRREMDVVLSSGERVSIALLAMAIQELGFSARSLTGRQVGIITDEDFTRARIREVRCERIWKIVDAGQAAVVAGFQGISPSEDVTTLGRGGSDLTAVAMAAADATVVLPYNFTRLIWAALFGFLFFAEVPDLWTWVGGAVIFISSVWLTRINARRGKEDA